MPAERIAESLAFINWTILTGLAIGSFGAVALGRLRTDATRGYLAFTGVVAVLLGLLAIVSDRALPGAAAGSPIAIDGSWDEARRAAMALFCGLAIAYVVAILRRQRAPLLAGTAMAAGAAVLGLAAIAWGGGALGTVLLAVQLVTLTAALGGVWAAMVLGHWYLVTPKLAEAPLVRFARTLAIIVAAQIVLFVAWIGLGAGPAGVPGFGALVGSWALFVWLRLLIGLVFPLVVSWAAIQTARTRSMESATGLLYIDVGTIAAGTILAAGLYFGAGLLV
ncbi:MAG TPA: hypothetical protein VKC59_08565 [Candidatus Limnocylindrales bacterium]|nr:hypothetical protein [Candidatus Limnocylindrales bacterium]